MSEVVDSIIADLDVRYEKYVKGFNEAIAVNDRFGKSVDRLRRLGMDPPPQYAASIAREAGKGAAAHEAAATRMSRTTKKRTEDEIAAAEAVKRAVKEARDAERVAAKAAADAVKAAEREKQAALKATQREQEKAAKASAEKAAAERVAAAASVAAAEREIAARMRLAEVAQRAVDRRVGQIAPAVKSSLGATVPRETTGQRGISAAALDVPAAAGEVAAEKEVNHLLADRFDLQQRVRFATGAEKRELADQIDLLARINRYKAAGLAEDEAMVRAEAEMLAISKLRSDADRKKGASGAAQFARGAGVNGIGAGGTAAIAGIATAVGVGVGVEVIQSAVEYGKALDDLSKQLGITVEDLQAYQKIARDTGVEVTTLSSAFGQFASNLGKAQQGNAEQAKTFKALGVNIKDFATAGDALPTVIDRISNLKDPLQRAGIEARLFGEEGRKLDPLLSGGAEAVSKLAASLQETGQALSAKEIQELDETARKLGEVKNQLSVDFARIVAGNSDAIIGLANSFAQLAGRVLETIQRIQQYNDARARVAPDFLASDEDKAKSRRNSLNTAGGRQDLLRENSAALRALEARTTPGANDGRILAAQKPGAPRKTVAQVLAEERAAGRKVLLAERREVLTAGGLAPKSTAAVQSGTSNQNLIRNLDTPKAPKGPKGKSAESIAREEEQRTKQFNDQVAQANGEFLRAQQQLAMTAGQRADIELQILDTAYKARLADIDSNAKRNKLAGSDAALEDTRAAELKAAERRAYLADQSITLQQRDFDVQRDLTAGAQTLLDIQAGLISSQLVIATTAKERRRLSLELLENEKKQEYNRLAGVIGSSAPGSQESLDAEQKLAGLDKEFEGRTKSTLQATAGPLEAYRDSLHRATDDTNEALEGVAVNALGRLEDTVASSIGKVLGLKGAFGDLFGSILTDIAKIELKKGILALLGEGGESGSKGKLSGLIAGVAKLFGGRASGGNVVGGGNYLVGENGPEILSMPSSGRVYPNGQLPGITGAGSGKATLTQHISIDARNSVVPAEFAGAILGEANKQARVFAQQAGRAAVEATPARIQRYSKLGS